MGFAHRWLSKEEGQNPKTKNTPALCNLFAGSSCRAWTSYRTRTRSRFPPSFVPLKKTTRETFPALQKNIAAIERRKFDNMTLITDLWTASPCNAATGAAAVAGAPSSDGQRHSQNPLDCAAPACRSPRSMACQIDLFFAWKIKLFSRQTIGLCDERRWISD